MNVKNTDTFLYRETGFLLIKPEIISGYLSKYYLKHMVTIQSRVFVRRNKTDTSSNFVFLLQLFDIYMNYVNYSTITDASSRSDENRPNPVDTLIIIINNRLIYI